MPKRIVIAEDEAIISEMYEKFIEDLGHEVVGITDTATDTIEKACSLKPLTSAMSSGIRKLFSMIRLLSLKPR